MYPRIRRRVPKSQFDPPLRVFLVSDKTSLECGVVLRFSKTPVKTDIFAKKAKQHETRDEKGLSDVLSLQPSGHRCR